MNRRHRPAIRLAAVAAATMGGAVMVGWLLRSPSRPISRDDYAIVMALCRACNQHDHEAIETTCEIFDEHPHSSSKSLQAVVRRVVKETESQNWLIAETACRDFMRQQIRPR